MKAKPADRSFSVDQPEGLVLVWRQIVGSLRQSGFSEAGEQYLKLSRLVRDHRHRQLLAGDGKAHEQWRALGAVAREAEILLDPVLQAARILAELPLRIEVSSASSPPQETQGPPAPAGAGAAQPAVPETPAQASKPRRRKPAPRAQPTPGKRVAKRRAGTADASPA